MNLFDHLLILGCFNCWLRVL